MLNMDKEVLNSNDMTITIIFLQEDGEHHLLYLLKVNV